MNKRKILVFFTQTSKKEFVDTNSSTWGELKAHISGDIGNKTCVLSGSKHVLALDDAALPEGEFTVFVYPKESKGGVARRPAKKVKKVAKKVKKTAKKAKNAAPKKKKVAKKAAKKKKASPRKVEAKSTLGNILSATEKAAVEREEALEREANEIGRGIKGFR